MLHQHGIAVVIQLKQHNNAIMSHTHLSGPLHLCTDKEIVGPFGTWHQGSLPTVCVISVNLAALSRCSVETHVAKVWEIPDTFTAANPFLKSSMAGIHFVTT